MQLHPHFLFNTLHSISTLVNEDPEAAEAMIARLSELLRLSLENTGAQEVPLSQELEFIERYLEIEQIRFEDRLRIHFNIDPQTLDALVPNLILQPLVENAIRHGISPRSSGGTVMVTAERDTNHVEIRIADDGVGLPTGWTMEKSLGTGLVVTRERVLGLYPHGNGRFFVRPRIGGGTEVEISLPLRFAGTS
jgi:LytS/YehU family sensor histidine kinase